jgi:hypothetical protein
MSLPALDIPGTASKPKGTPRKYQDEPSSWPGVGIIGAWFAPVSRTNCSFLHYCGRLARIVGFCSCTVDSASQASRSHMSQCTLASASMRSGRHTARAKKSGPLTPPFPNRPHWRAARPPLVDAQATTPGGAPKERTRGRAATGRAEQAELVLKSPGEKEHGAQRSVPRLWKRSFCSSGPDKNGTVSCRIHRCWSSTPSCVRCERLAGMAVCAL